MSTAQVVHDKVTGQHRVICPYHGELARYRSYWAAAYDAIEHDKNCGEYEEMREP